MKRGYALAVLPWVATAAAACRPDDKRPAGEPIAASAKHQEASQQDSVSTVDPERLPFPADAQRAAEDNRRGVPPALQVAVFGGGCFWGMQELLRKVPGVVETQVGYTGGADDNPTYEEVSTGTTGNAETVKVVFDPAKTTYEKLVEWFFRIHDPTTLDRQENDIGTQYRSVIFYQTPDQGKVAMEVKARADRSGKLRGPVVTQIVPAMRFHRAEDYHQDYLQKHPDGYTCHFVRPDIF